MLNIKRQSGRLEKVLALGLKDLSLTLALIYCMTLDKSLSCFEFQLIRIVKRISSPGVLNEY